MSAAEKLERLVNEWQSSPENEKTILSALREIIAVVEAGQSIYLGFTCPQDPMDCDERLECFAAALAALDEALT